MNVNYVDSNNGPMSVFPRYGGCLFLYFYWNIEKAINQKPLYSSEVDARDFIRRNLVFGMPDTLGVYCCLRNWRVTDRRGFWMLKELSEAMLVLHYCGEVFIDDKYQGTLIVTHGFRDLMLGWLFHCWIRLLLSLPGTRILERMEDDGRDCPEWRLWGKPVRSS